jgi:hypothetical protein
MTRGIFLPLPLLLGCLLAAVVVVVIASAFMTDAQQHNGDKALMPAAVYCEHTSHSHFSQLNEPPLISSRNWYCVSIRLLTRIESDSLIAKLVISFGALSFVEALISPSSALSFESGGATRYEGRCDVMGVRVNFYNLLQWFIMTRSFFSPSLMSSISINLPYRLLLLLFWHMRAINWCNFRRSECGKKRC